MSTARVSQPPVLDRLITVSATESVPLALRYSERTTSGQTTTGQYSLNSPYIFIYRTDEDGKIAPTSLDAGAMVSLTWGDYRFTYALTGYFSISQGLRYRLEGDLSGLDTTQATGEMMLTIAGQTVERTVKRETWANRRDVSVRDELLTTQVLTAIQDRAVYTVRNEYPGNQQSVSDRFTDENGETRTIEGIAEMGRQRYLKFLARAGL